jgi:hypothetical protein
LKIKLAADLEKALLRSIAEGLCQPDIVTAEELSKTARQTFESICHLLKNKAAPPLRPAAILLTAQSLFGVDKEEYKAYLKSFKDLDVGNEIGAILRSARDKTLLVRLINEAGAQLAKGHLDVREISTLVEKNSTPTESIKAMALSVRDKFPVPPRGIPIRSLPLLSEATNGLIGVWIIGGEPGLGKSTLAFQLALDAGENIPAVYYDLDGTGHEWLLDRVRCIARNDVKAFRKLTQKFYLRETIATLEDDLSFVRKEHGEGKALVVIDSLQTLPTSIKYKKEGLDSWINRFKQLSKKEVVVVLVSEQNRAAYGEAKMSGFKGSGDIEYAGSLCIQLLQEEGSDAEDPVQVHVVKNRHGKRKGHIIDLDRDKKREFWFNEDEAE